MRQKMPATAAMTRRVMAKRIQLTRRSSSGEGGVILKKSMKTRATRRVMPMTYALTMR